MLKLVKYILAPVLLLVLIALLVKRLFKVEEKVFKPLPFIENNMKYPKHHWDAMANQIHSLLGGINTFGTGLQAKAKVKQLLMWDNVTPDDRAYLYNSFGLRAYLMWGYFFNWGVDKDLFEWIEAEYTPMEQLDIRKYWSEEWKGN